MPRIRKFRKPIARSGTSFIAVALLAVGPLAAQPAPAADEEPVELPVPESGSPEEMGEEIVVTGSSIRGVPPTGSNLISVTREDIRTVGATTTADLVATVPQLNSFNTAPRRANGGAGSFAPGLRGLPPSSTLVLMNGHRLVAGGANQTNPDFPFIPDLALERVEIVADGASSIYGSDAIAGVVNFITRKRASGIEASVRYGVAEDYHTFSASALAGHDWGTGSVLAAYQYSENGNITGADRDYRVQDFRPYGGVDTRGTSCPAANLTLDGITYFAAPAFAPNTLNRCDTGAPVDLVPAMRLHSAFLTARQDVTDRVTLWGEVLYSDRKDTVQAALPAQTVLITAANPYFQGPPGAPFAFAFFRPDNLVGDDHFDQIYRVKTGNSSAGVDVALPGEFNLSVYGTYDWARHDAFQPMINPAAIAAAGVATTEGAALDVFGDRTSAAVIDAITDYSTTVRIEQRTKLAAVKIDGPLVELPGGPLKVAAGAEYRRETFQQRGFVGASPVPEDLGRNIKSIYGEIFVPIFGDGNEAPFMRRLSLSLSGRYDHYSDFGSTANPKIGLDWEPVHGLTIRGTYGTSFRAPGLRDVGATVGAYYIPAASLPALGLYDPTRTTQVDTIVLYGGNRDLQPEEARTFSIGAELRPVSLPNFHASVTFYDIRYTNVIGTPGGSVAFTDPTFASVVFRDPSAAQLAGLLALGVPVNFVPSALPAIGNALDFRQGNFGVRETNGLDFDIGYRLPTGFGSVFAGLAGNHILKFDTQLSPTAPRSDSLQLGVPRTALRATLGITDGASSLVGFVNYRAGITNLFNTPTGPSEYEADGYMTVDLRATIPVTGTGAELSLQVNDLFDEAPPFFPGTDGIGGNYNPIGRYVALGLRAAF